MESVPPAANLGRRALTTGDFLVHDMTPNDPYVRSKSMYEPSAGDPIRDARFRGFTSKQMMDSHKPNERSFMEMETEKQMANQNFKRAQVSDQFRRNDPTPKADQVDQFYNGSYTTPQTRQQGIKAREGAPRTEKYKAEVSQYIDEVKKYKDEVAQQRDREKRQDLEMLKNYDPWSKTTVPTGTKHKVGMETVNRQTEKQVDGAYTQVAFGKPGAGAPIRTSSGKVQTHYHVDPDTQMSNVYRDNLGATAASKFGNAGAPDADSPFGKPGGGAPLPDTKVTRKPQAPASEIQRKVTYAETLAKQAQEQEQRRKQEKTGARQPAEGYEPWGRGVGAPERDASGKLLKKAKDTGAGAGEEGSMAGMLGKPGGGAPTMNGTGKMSPKKPMEPAASELFDPWGKPGAGAPTGQTRVAGKAKEMMGAESSDPLKKQQLAKEQQQYLEVHREITNTQKMAQSDSQPNSEDFFRWGQGTSNPKRDETGRLVNQHREQTDVIGMNMDKGGGLGRKQKNSQSQQLHKDLERQAAERRAQEQEQRSREVAAEVAHNQMSSSWQGKEGAGAPRHGPNGEISGRFGLDREVHLDEVVGTVKVIPKEERVKYGQELTRLKTEREQTMLNTQDITRSETDMHLANANRNFGRQGNGAPLRTGSGSVVPHPSRVRDKEDYEWKLNAKQGHKME